MDHPFTCLYCGAPMQGRSDKKFCDDGCRNLYHNRRNRLQHGAIRHINRILARNYRLLKALAELPQKEFTREELLLKGFNFEYFTSFDRSGSKICRYWVYDTGYHFLKNNHITVVKNNNTNDTIRKTKQETPELVKAQYYGSDPHGRRIKHNH